MYNKLVFAGGIRAGKLEMTAMSLSSFMKPAV